MKLTERLRASALERARLFVRRQDAAAIAATLRIPAMGPADLEILQTLASIKAIVGSPIDLLVDVGAHVGRFTVPAAQALGARRALCFEPNIKLHNELRANLRQLDAETRPCALADRPGSRLFHVHADPHMSSLF